MYDTCPPIHEWRFYVNPEPYLHYLNFALGLLLAAPLALILRCR